MTDEESKALVADQEAVSALSATTERPKKTEFSEWYNDVIERAELCDKRYSIKGMNVWRPYGWQLMMHVDRLIRAELDKRGFCEVAFPLLIPEDEFAKEKEHIKGFDEQVYWVTRAGGNELDVKLLLRPTSETAMYPMFALWVRSHKDLPLRTYQIVNTFRYETKQTRPFIRVREIHFFEAHTCHTTFEDAERQIAEYLDIFETLAKKLCLPYFLAKRPDWDKFAGAFYTIGIDVLMPNGKTLQIGSVHQYRDNFSKPYNIVYEDVNAEHQYVHQTTYGMSERLLGAIIGVHGDDKGIVLPPEVAPIQIVIVPVLKKDKQALIVEECEKVAGVLRKRYRVHLDTRDIRPGSKYYDWELRGVPLRIEIGPKDIAEDIVVFVRRDTSEKCKVPHDAVLRHARKTLRTMERELLREAQKMLKVRIETFDALKCGKDITGISWCGDEVCGKEIEVTLGVKSLGTIDERKNTECVICGKPSTSHIYVAKMY